MRRRLLALVLSTAAITALAPAASADAIVDQDGPYVCLRSRLLLGDPICIEIYPGS